jgi:hypothetical protein
VREAIANNRIENLPVNKVLEERLLTARQNNERFDAERLIDEFVRNI